MKSSRKGRKVAGGKTGSDLVLVMFRPQLEIVQFSILFLVIIAPHRLWRRGHSCSFNSRHLGTPHEEPHRHCSISSLLPHHKYASNITDPMTSVEDSQGHAGLIQIDPKWYVQHSCNTFATTMWAHSLFSIQSALREFFQPLRTNDPARISLPSTARNLRSSTKIIQRNTTRI